MPLYEYKCRRCGKTFEVRQKFADDPLKVHTECGGQVARVISAPALVFKGTGWYVTDYGRGGSLPSANGSNGSNGSHGKSESKSGSGSESKPAESKPTPASSSADK
jgi:putative FmdB family regulatory protein